MNTTFEAPATVIAQAAPGTPGPFKPTPETRTPDAMAAPVTPERVTSAGLVRIHNEEVIAAVPLYSYAERSQWYGPNRQNGFSKLSDAQAKSFVAEYGFNKTVKDGQGNTAADRAMIYLIQNRAVAYAGALAGHPSGCHEVEGTRILVTDSPRLISPHEGNCLVEDAEHVRLRRTRHIPSG